MPSPGSPSAAARPGRWPGRPWPCWPASPSSAGGRRPGPAGRTPRRPGPGRWSTLALPDGYGPGATHVDRASAVTAPAATRTWTAPAGAPACADLRDRLAAWADRGTLRGAPGNTAGRCSWWATWHGHRVDAGVLRQGDAGTVSVRLAG